MNEVFLLLRAALWEKIGVKVKVTYDIYQELKLHALETIPAPILSSLDMPDSLRKTWKMAIIYQAANYAKYQYEQTNLPVDVPYVILKGTSAAQYYPHPEFRAMGDIDIMTRHEDYELFCESLQKNGYKEKIANNHEQFGRHRGFVKNGILVEVHNFFSLLNDRDEARYLDDLIIENINASHVLPDLVNGLVLLEHISQHMEGGIGLRHIIDWMMFVDKCLSDSQWCEFQAMAKMIGLDKLAVVATRMCELYLGLHPHCWSENADKKLCKQLMEYVVSCGNFGKKRTSKNNPGASVLSYARTPMAVFRLLQERGLINWVATQKYRILKPFAWIYQFFRYIKKGLGRDYAIKELRKEILAARERVNLFDALGVKQISKGLAVFENGEYKKTYKRP